MPGIDRSQLNHFDQEENNVGNLWLILPVTALKQLSLQQVQPARGEEVGIHDPVIVLGDQLNSTTDSALEHLAEQCTVFARVTPIQKKSHYRRALRRRGHVVGYMGDGINDAPSLHSADVGISVLLRWM